MKYRIIPNYSHYQCCLCNLSASSLKSEMKESKTSERNQTTKGEYRPSPIWNLYRTIIEWGRESNTHVISNNIGKLCYVKKNKDGKWEAGTHGFHETVNRLMIPIFRKEIEICQNRCMIKNRKLLASSAKNDYLCSTQGMNDGDTLHCCSMKRTGHRNDWQRGEHHIHRIAQWQLPLPEARRCLMEFSNSKGGFY